MNIKNQNQTTLFHQNDLKNVIPKIHKNHPFLPDRHWLKEDLEEKLAVITSELNQGKWDFSSIEAYFEWQEKPISAIKMSTQDWLVHFILLQKLEEILQPFFIPNTHYQLTKMDGLLAQCRQWKNANPNGWIFKTDIQGFFKNINSEILLKLLEGKINSPVLICLVKQYLLANEKAMIQLKTERPNDEIFPKNHGLPIGAELNYLLASTYLLPMDKMLFESKKVLHYARYVDDILLFFGNENDGVEVQEILENNLEKLGLQLNLEKSKMQSNELIISFLRVKF